MMEKIPRRQAIGIITVFLFGSSLILGINSETGQDSWISQLLSALMAIPVIMIYARLCELFPEKDLFDIFSALFGKFGGKILGLILLLYSFHLGGLVMRNMSCFLKVVTMPETPRLPIALLISVLVIYIVKSGMETFSKFALVIMYLTSAIVLITTLLGLRQMDFTNILPVFGHNFREITASSYKILTFPYAETVLFLCVADSLGKNENPFKIYFSALLISTAIMTAVILRNILLMGPALMQAEYYPSYVAARLILVGDFLSRIEGSLSLNFVLGGSVKVSLCAFAAAKGTAKLFGIQNYRQLAFPVVLLILAIGVISFKDVMEMFAFLNYYQYYAIPFQFAIPVATWITAEVKAKKNWPGPAPQAQTQSGG